MTFLHIVGPEVLEVDNSFTWTEDDDKKKLNKIIEYFKNYCNHKKHITMERYTFNMRKQGANEGFDVFHTDFGSNV